MRVALLRFGRTGSVLLLLLAGLVGTVLGQAQDDAVFGAVDLEVVADGLVAPITLAAPPGEERLFVAEQTGVVRILDADGSLLPQPFLDVRPALVPLRESYDERGLLGFAVHPDYPDDGRVFVYYSAPLRDEAPEAWDHTDRLSVFEVSEDDPTQVDPDSERILLHTDQPQMNHNGGALAFGPDGYLYVSIGDGGDADDTGIGHPPLGNAQDVTTRLGAILRLDVEGGDPYAVPQDNPFVGRELPDEHPFSGDALVPEIWAWGFRHPWRMSFDPGGQGALFVSDAGENLWEEIDRITEPGNFGWNLKEGFHGFDPEHPNVVLENAPEHGYLGEPLVDPILAYRNARGRNEGIGVVVVGGEVYRGEAIPELDGHYVFADWSRSFEEPRGVLMIAAPSDDGEGWDFREVREIERGAVQGFGRDAQGELYVLVNGSHGPSGQDGAVLRLVPGEP